MAPMATTTQAAIRARPEIEGLILLVSVLTAVLLLVGGAVGDTRRARPIITGGLAVSLVCAILALVLDSGDASFRIVRFAGIASAAMVMPVALAMAATAYTGIARATAIGIAYAAYGAGQGLSPTLVAFVPGSYAPAFVGSIAACALALVVVRGRIPELPRPTAAERPYVYGTALWATGVVLFAAGVLWLGVRPRQPAADRADPGRHRPGRCLHPLGAPPQGGQCRDRAHRTPSGDRRAVRGPGHRHRADRADVAAAALLRRRDAATARSSGSSPSRRCSPPSSSPGRWPAILLARFRPRLLISGGMLAIGLGDLLVAALIGPTTTYVAFIVPLRADRRRVRHRHDGADGDHLRQRAPWPAGDRGGAQRGIDRGRHAGRDHRRHRHPGRGRDRRLHGLGRRAAGRRGRRGSWPRSGRCSWHWARPRSTRSPRRSSAGRA